jgi:putative spermidine/putrescine transport system permease protein
MLVLLLVPALGFLTVFFIYPMIDILLRSIDGPTGITFEHYARFFERSVYVRVLMITFEIAASVTVLSLIIAYPLAFVLSTSKGRTSAVLMAMVLIPFFTSILVRTYAWIVILGPEGILNQTLNGLGFGAVQLLYNRTSVLIGMTYTLLPYMVLTLYSVMRGMDFQLVRAAYSLGASDWNVFRRIFLPHTMPGIVGGSLLVFILAVGYYITPRLMGGDRDQMMATIIEYQVDLLLNWNFASALATILLIVTLGGFALYAWSVGLRTLFESRVA